MDILLFLPGYWGREWICKCDLFCTMLELVLIRGGAFFCLFSSCFPSFGPVILNPALHLFFVHLINGPHRFGVRCHVVIFIFFYGSLNHLLHYWDLAMHLGAPFVSNPTPLPDIHIFWLSWTADMRAAGL